jgi:TonB family protein
LVLASDEDSSLNALKFSLASEIVELVVLTGDETFLQTLREAVGGARRLWHVPSADKVSDLLVAGGVGIVVLDVAALHEPAQVFVTQIKLQFPDLVIVVAGNRESENSLAAQISAGAVYRFIHKPLSPGRARLFVEAAVRRYDEQRLRSASLPVYNPPSSKLPWIIAALVAAVALAGAIFWSLRTGSPADEASVFAGADKTHASSPLLAQAAAALAANRLTAPAGDNALELYLRATAQRPADPLARAGLSEVRERLLAKAENSLLEERLDEAAADIEIARKAGVESGRIAFLSAQLAKSRDQLRAAQSAVRARNEPKPGAPGPTAAQSAAADKLNDLVNLATARLGASHLIDPEKDNARYYVEEALKLDANDADAQDVKRQLAVRLLNEARASMDRRDFAHAADWIQAAEGIAVPANIETSQGLLAAARKQAQTDAYAQLLKNVSERVQQDRLIEPVNDNAKYYLLTLRGLDPQNPGLAPAVQELGTRLVAKARLALTLQQIEAARSWLDEASGLGFSSAEGNAVRHDLDAVASQKQFMDNIVPSSALTLLKSAQPVYPPKAQSAKIDGWVELDFTVAETGQVSDVSVLNGSPTGVFDEAAIKAVTQWRYAPVLRDGKPVPVRSRVRIRFSLP